MFSSHCISRTRRYALLLLSVAGVACASFPVLAQDGDGADTASVTELVRNFLDAQLRHDVPALRKLTAEQFVEISPLGEVDPRDKMLGFYMGDAPAARPTVGIDERQVRIFGDSALANVKITYNLSGQARSMRTSFVAYKDGAHWKLVSVQHTPIRPAKS